MRAAIAFNYAKRPDPPVDATGRGVVTGTFGRGR